MLPQPPSFHVLSTLQLRRLLAFLFCAMLIVGVACDGDADDDPDNGTELDAGDDAGDLGDIRDDDTDDADDADDTGDVDDDDTDGADDADDADDTGDVDDDPVPIPEGQARIQVIHAAADPAADSVDVYLDDALVLDDFDFRTTTPFFDVDAGAAFSVAIAPADSESSADALSTFSEVALATGERTIIIVSGVVDPGPFEANPGDEDVELALYTFADARERSNDPSLDQIVLFHAATDQPALAMALPDGTEVLAELTYGEFAPSYLALPPGVLAFDLLTSDDADRIGSFQTPDLQGGDTFVVVATGFGDDAQNGDASFELTLFPSRYGGERSPGVALDEAARLQLIHNAPDPEAASVDLYFDNQLTYPAVAFREATSFRTVVAGADLGLLATAEGDVSTEVLTSTLTLGNGQSAVVAIGGVTDPADFTPNPDGEDIALRVFLFSEALEEARDPERVDLLFFHGVPDAPSVAAVVDDEGAPAALSESLTYGDFDGYLSVAPEDIVAQITPDTDLTTALASFELPLSLLAGEALTVLASGLLTSVDEDRSLAILVVSADGALTVLSPLE